MKVLVSITDSLSLHRVLRLRHRRFLTRNNTLRLRYVASSMVIASLSMGSLLGATANSVAYVYDGFNVAELLPAQSVDERPVVQLASAALNADDAAVSVPFAPVNGVKEDGEIAALDMPVSPFVLPDAPLVQEPREEILKIGSGETLVGVLQGVGVSDQDAYRVVKEMSKHYDPRAVKAGQAVAVRLEPGEDGLEFAEMNLKIDPIKEVVVEKTAEAGFEAEIKEKKVLLQTKSSKAKIETSLYGSAARAGIPASVVAEMIRIYSYQVDFQRDIREGDQVEIAYETYETEDGDFARYGNVLYANLVVSGKNMPVYRFTPDGGAAGYYTPDGKSTKKSIMRTPIDGARMSSGFGMRRHPVLGYNKMHKGADFAAPRGTPIYAAGNGVVEFAGRKGAYGNYVSIRHNGAIKTAYAHMHKFAKGISAGKKVAQGDIIGYVGTTGRSTGPHLHFEILKNNVQVNPASVNMPDTNKLVGSDLKKFKGMVANFEDQYASMTGGVAYAKAENFTSR